MGGRVRKSLLNARVNLIFYFLSLFFSFFSRKIFLDCLGADFIGLTGTLGNILGYLNLAELGVGAAISFFLFKPILNNDRGQINEILSVFGFLYRKIGEVILAVGLLISLFFPFIFHKSDIGMGIVYFSFFSFLGSSLVGYFINYRQILLAADQKNYLVSIYFQSAGLIKIAIQIYLVYTFRNLYLWITIEFVFSVLACIVLNRRIDREYPWLKTNMREGKVLLKKYPEILKNARQIFIHKIKDFLLTRSDEIFIFAFVSLKMVAYYGNYTIIITKLSMLFSSIFDGIAAGVGNLVAENKKENTMKVFWELMSIRHFIAGFMFVSLYFLMEPFIALWLGAEYILDKSILLLLLVYMYIMQSRNVVDMFNHAYGLYADTWSAWVELVLNVGITVGAGMKYGIAGILMGKIISIFLIVVLWKPYYLFSKGLRVSLTVYWKGVLRYYLIFFGSFMITSIVARILPLNPYDNMGTFLGYAIIVVGSYLIFNLSLLYLCTYGMKDVVVRLKRIKK